MGGGGQKSLNASRKNSITSIVRGKDCGTRKDARIHEEGGIGCKKEKVKSDCCRRKEKKRGGV